jgi:TonB-dependent starch-binding outer membrane protein SusC
MNLPLIYYTFIMKKTIQYFFIYSLMCLLSFSALAQNVQVSGKVIAQESSEPMAGVTVVVVGSTVGTSTAADGTYQINTPPNSTLQFSFIGYTTESVIVGNRTTINVTLVPDIQSLGEVTVLGYGEQVKRRNLSGAVATVKGTEFQNVPFPSVEQMIQGRAAGVQITANSGAPGSGITVRVRGTTSISADNQPLWVVDGVPLRNEPISGSLAVGATNSPIADLNPADIESIEVLKDASTAAIYGARAANGVVLVTTKRGKSGKAQIRLDMQQGVSMPPRKLQLLDATQSKAMTSEYLFQSSDGNGFSIDRSNPITQGGLPRYQFGWYPDGVRSVDYQDLIRQNGIYSTYNLSVAGGIQKSVLYSLSGGYTRDQGTIRSTDYTRGNVRANVDLFPMDRLQAGASLNLSLSGTKFADRGTFSTDPIEAALRYFPDIQPYIVDPLTGIPTSVIYDDHPQDRANPLNLVTNLTNKESQTRGFGQVYAQYQIIPDALTFRMNLGADVTNTEQRRFRPVSGKFFRDRQTIQQVLGNLTWNTDYILNFLKTYGVHEVQGLAAYAVQSSTNKLLRVGGISGANDAPVSGYINSVGVVSGVGPNMSDVAGNEITSGISTMTVKGTYTYNDLVSVSALVNRNVSSRFPASTREGIFPAVSGFFRVSRLGSLSDSPLLSDLKVRSSWGVLGNQNGISEFSYLVTYGAGQNYAALGAAGAGITTTFLPNQNLRWETTATTNVGLDWGILDSRFYLVLDYYVKNTKDLLLPVNLPTTSGFASYVGNVGRTRNSGWELGITGDIVNTRNFRWNINYNAATNRNVFVESASGDDIIANFGNFRGIGRVGEPIGTWYGLKRTNVLPRDEDAILTQIGTRDDGQPLYALQSSIPGSEAALDPVTGAPLKMRSRGIGSGLAFLGGDLMYEDVNQDGFIDQLDYQVIGRAQPKLYGGLNNTFSYKGFMLDVFFQYQYGNDVINATRQMLESGGRDDNSSIAMARSWRTQGDITDIPRIVGGGPNRGSGLNAWQGSDRWVEDGSYLRLKTVSISYNLPKSFVSRVKVDNVRVFVTGNNLLTFTRYKGYDPEFNNSANLLLLGLDYMNYPLARRFVGGLNLTF